jgi:signal transduction histidine kinase
VEWLADHYQQRSGLEIVVHSGDRQVALDDELRIVLFQAARELLVNVIKHAQAKRVVISLQYAGDWIELTIEDDGDGFDLEKASSRPASEGGFGLFSIRERLKLLGAELEINSLATGTLARVRAPT